MYDGQNRYRPDWESQQPVPFPYVHPHRSSDYAFLSPSQRSPSPSGYPGDDHLNYYSGGNHALFSPQHDNLSSSGRSFSTSSSTGSVIYEWSPQADPSSNLVLNQSSQQYGAENDSILRRQPEYGDSQLFQPVILPTLPSNILGLPGTSPNASNLLSRTELAVYDYHIPGQPFYQGLVATASDPKNFAPQLSAVRSFPSSCGQCNNGRTIYSVNEFYIHYWSEHPPSLRSQDAWVPQRCLWKGCKLKNHFKTPKHWLNHAFDVHLKRFRCDISYCGVGPFGSRSMLLRHQQTMHKKPLHCDKKGCQAKRLSNLCRKDKSDAHEAKWHGPIECEVPACPRRRIDGVDHGFSTQEDLGLHNRKDHRGS